MLSTITGLAQQLETVSKTFEELMPTSSGSDVHEIQELVTQLRAAIDRFSATES